MYSVSVDQGFHFDDASGPQESRTACEAAGASGSPCHIVMKRSGKRTKRELMSVWSFPTGYESGAV